MSERMTITIPDELKKRLDPYRGQLNLSQICAQALEREVSIMEGVSGDPSELDKLVAQVKVQKDEAEQESFSVGFQDGLKAARHSDYADFVFADRTRRGDPPFALPEIAEEQLQVRLEDSPWVVLDPSAYRRGWLHGMLAVWQRIEDQL